MLPKTIVAFGGSTLFGMVDPNYGGYIGRLKTWHESQDVHNKIYNLGISGDSSTGMLKRLLPEAQIRKPDLILISTGLNDTRKIRSKTNPTITPLEQFTHNVEELIKQAQSLAKVVFISACPIDESKTAPLTFWNPEYYYFLEDAKLYTQTVKEICEKNHIPYIDIFNEWIHEDYIKLLYQDGLHANAAGHERIFEALRKFLEDLYK